MVCILWDQDGIIYYELLKRNETITGERYQTQLMRLSRALCEKWPQYEQSHEKVILQHDNAHPHVVKPLKNYLQCSNEKFYSNRRILQILLRPIITCSRPWHMVWLISSSSHMEHRKMS